MKTLIAICLMAAMVPFCCRAMTLPPTTETNVLAEMMRIKTTDMAMRAYQSGRVARLEQEVNRLEEGFVGLLVVVGATFAGASLLALRDWVRTHRSTGTTKS